MEIHRQLVMMLIGVACFVSLSSSIEANAKPLVTAMFVFGDSLSDNGNNIYSMSAAQTKFWPYGMDLDKGPTGRFSNGKIFVDYIGELLGLPLIPSYAETVAKSVDVRTGVNYASAAAGILEDTGYLFGRVIPLRGQIDNFRNTLTQLKDQMETEELNNYLAKAFVFLAMGANDYLNNYIVPPLYRSSLTYNPQEYADLLIKLYTGHIMELQKLGLRKFFIAEVSPIGCIPAMVSSGLIPPGECESRSNNLVSMFNSRLKPLVHRLNSDNPGSIFTLGAAFEMFIDLRNNADSHGFRVKDKACCGMGINKGKPVCLPDTEPCFNRDEYLFWDSAHPTQAASRNVAYRMFNSTSYCFPMSIQKMAEL